MSVRTYENRETKRRNADVKMRIEALHEALDAGRSWLTEAAVAHTEKQLAIARGRLRESLDHTVVAISGPTGAGKSSLINALSQREIAKVSVRRPTTSHALAVIWDSSVQGREHAARLLDWLGVPERRYLAESDEPAEPQRKSSLFRGTRFFSPNETGDMQENVPASSPIERVGSAVERVIATVTPTTHKSAASAHSPASSHDNVGGSEKTIEPHKPRKAKKASATGLIVVDLPDFDSIVAEHRVRADHLTERSDVLVWVTDPQKYADAVFHHEYLKKFNQHTEMLVVLNQVDRLSTKQKEQCLADIRRLLVKDGITSAKVLAVSTKTGEGISELKSLLAVAAERRAAQANSLVAELRACGRRIAEECGQVPSRNESGGPKEALIESLAQAGGVYPIAEAVYESALRRSHIATGWPVTAWVARFKRDPLRTLGLANKWIPHSERSATPNAPLEEIHPATARSSMKPADGAVAAQANLAVRQYVDAATAGGPTPWIMQVRGRMSETDLGDDLDSAITNSPAIRLSRPQWWTVISVLHRIFLTAFLAGALWLAFLAVSAYLRIDVPNTPTWMGFPIPTLLTLGGLVLGIALGLICRILAIIHARRQSRRVFDLLRKEVEEVASQRVILPVRELRDQRETCVLAALVAGR